jgi:hypothetical protein
MHCFDKHEQISETLNIGSINIKRNYLRVELRNYQNEGFFISSIHGTDDIELLEAVGKESSELSKASLALRILNFVRDLIKT